MSKKIERIEDLVPDIRNANKGTERGQYMVEHSLSQYGAGRSILADTEGRVIAGNKTLQAAADLGIPVRVVETDGTELVVVQRTDLDLADGDKARLMAYADNQASAVGLDWSAEEIAIDIGEGLDLSGEFFEFELEDMLAELNVTTKNLDELEEEYGEPRERDFWPVIRVQVSPETMELWESLMAQTGIENEADAAALVIGAVDATVFGSV